MEERNIKRDRDKKINKKAINKEGNIKQKRER
jgi:hypothetical protein